MNDRDDDAREAVPATAGGGPHDITGAEAAEHVGQSSDGAHAAHGGAHGDGEEDQPLGPIDWAAWRAAAAGVAIAVLICFLLYVAIAA